MRMKHLIAGLLAAMAGRHSAEQVALLSALRSARPGGFGHKRPSRTWNSYLHMVGRQTEMTGPRGGRYTLRAGTLVNGSKSYKSVYGRVPRRLRDVEVKSAHQYIFHPSEPSLLHASKRQIRAARKRWREAPVAERASAIKLAHA